MDEKQVGAYDDNPAYFRYRREFGLYLAMIGILNFITAGAFMYAVLNFFLAGDLALRNAGLLTGTAGILALWGLGYWNAQNKADKEELFTVWAIEHHGLTPIKYKLGSGGLQPFTSMETGEELTCRIINDDIEFKGTGNPKCRRVILMKEDALKN